MNRPEFAVLGAVSLGGAVGSMARYGISRWLPTHSGHFPWATFIVNVVGCLLIGVLMVLVTEVFDAHRLVRPFLGVGILGGFTTFSAYAVDFTSLVDVGEPAVAFGYLFATLAAALVAVVAGMAATRAVAGGRQ